MKKIILKIGGMSCAACSFGLEKYLKKQEGIQDVVVNLIMNHAIILFDENKITMEDLNRFVKEAGFESLGEDNLKGEEKEKRKEKPRLIFITILALLILYISMGHMMGLPAFPFLDMHQYPIFYTLSLLILSTIVMILERNILKSGYFNLIHKVPNMDSLVTIGVIASYGYSIYHTILILQGKTEFVTSLYYESAAIVLFFIMIGKYIENRSKKKTKEAIQSLMKLTPATAVILENGKQKVVTIDEIRKGDIVICKPGEKIAVDGIVTKGVSHLDESFITGESLPSKKEIGKPVIAGSINYEGYIEYQAEKIGKESTISEIVRLVVETTNTKAPISRIADKISGYFVPAMLVIATLGFLFWMMMGKGVSFSINIFISLLVIACPCALGLATPLAIVISSGICAKKGILLKNSTTLENAHKVKKVVLDKTGTITNGNLSIAKIFCYGDLSEEEVLKIVGGAEQKSNHPIGKAIVEACHRKNISLAEVSEVKEIAGYGVTANYQGKLLKIGNKKMMEQDNILVHTEDEEILTKEGNSILYMTLDQTIYALIGLKDTLKEGIVELVEELKRREMEVIMLTGDNELTAKRIAKEVGIQNVIAGVLPTEKAKVIQTLKQNEKGIVMMIGDGINDAPSLVMADIGVSVASGTDIAMNSSDIVLMQNEMTKLIDLIKISHKTLRNIKQNLFWAFFYNLAMIPIAFGVLNHFGVILNPMVASFAMTISSLTVVLNSLRLNYILK